MTTLLTADLSGYLDARAITAGDIGFDDNIAVLSVSGTNTLDDDDTPYSVPGERSWSVLNSGSVQGQTRWQLGSAVSSARVRFYFKTPAAWPSAAVSLFGFYSGSTRRGGVTMAGTGNPGAIRIIDGNSTNQYASANGVLAFSTWYYAEFSLNCTSSTVSSSTLDVFNLAGTNIASSGAKAGVVTGNTFQICTTGNAATSPVQSLTFAHIKVTDVIGTAIGAWVPWTTSAYATALAAVGTLAGYWKCDDGSGTTLTATNGSNGTIAASGMTYNATGLISDSSRSLTADGSTGEITTPVGSLTSFTLSFWFKTADTLVIPMRDATSAGASGWLLDLTGTNAVVRIDGTSRTLTPNVLSASLMDNTIHHCVLTFDSATNTATFYIDGAIVDQWVKASAAAPASPFHFMRNGTNNAVANYYAGTVDEISLHTTVVSRVGVNTLYTAGKRTITGPVIAKWNGSAEVPVTLKVVASGPSEVTTTLAKT